MYIGPESFMPLASAAAALLGGAMLFWRRTVDTAREVGRAIGRAGSTVIKSLRTR